MFKNGISPVEINIIRYRIEKISSLRLVLCPFKEFGLQKARLPWKF